LDLLTQSRNRVRVRRKVRKLRDRLSRHLNVGRAGRARVVQPVSVADLASFAETFADLDDPNVMSRAWQ
jgi:hypothetical protein